VVRALELAEALEAERDRVVAATLQERDRLRRDLHDGLGPSLSGVGLGLQALQDAQTAGDATVAEQLLGRICQEVATAVGEVRRILEDLRPALLDRAGLPDAVRQHAAAVASGQLAVSVDAAQLPGLPADVEAAAYRIIQEALTNWSATPAPTRLRSPWPRPTARSRSRWPTTATASGAAAATAPWACLDAPARRSAAGYPAGEQQRPGHHRHGDPTP
jgi:signal transduction histidine kinase